MRIKHLKEMTVSTSTTSYLTLANSSVAFTASGGQVQSKLTQAANTVQSILTGLVVLVGVCVVLSIVIKRMLDAGGPQEKSEVYRAVGHVVGLVALTATIIWLLSWVYSLSTWS